MLLFIIYFLQIAGFIIGLGAVTVIDWHGFLAQKSVYWTKATITAHKVTKPLIWTGTFLLIAGKTLDYMQFGLYQISFVNILLITLLILNGCFLSFYVSPYLVKLEKTGVNKPLQKSLQYKIIVSFLFSFFGWWGLVLIFIGTLLKLI